MWVNIFITLLSFSIGIIIMLMTSKQQQALQQTPDHILNRAKLIWTNKKRVSFWQKDKAEGASYLIWHLLPLPCLVAFVWTISRDSYLALAAYTILFLSSIIMGATFTTFVITNYIAKPATIVLLEKGHARQELLWLWEKYSHVELNHAQRQISLYYKRFPMVRYDVWTLPDDPTLRQAEQILSQALPTTPPRPIPFGQSRVSYLLWHGIYMSPTILFLISSFYVPPKWAWVLVAIACFALLIGVGRINLLINGGRKTVKHLTKADISRLDSLPDLPTGQDPILDKKERKWLLSREKMITYIVLISLFFILPFLLNRYVPEWEAWEFIYEIVSQLLPFLIPVLLVALGVTPFWERRLDNLIKSGIYEEALYILDQKRKYLREADYLVKRVQLQMWLGAYDKALLTAVYYIKNNQRNMEFVKRLQKDSQAPLINTHTFRPLAEVYMAIQEWEKAEAIVNYALSNTITTLNTPKLKTIHPHILAAQGKPFTKPTPPKVTRWGRFARWQNRSNQNEENKLVVMLHAMHALSYSDTPEQALPFIEAGEKLVQKDNVPEYAQWLTAVAHAYQANNDQSNYNQTLAELKRIDRTGHFQRALPQPKQ